MRERLVPALLLMSWAAAGTAYPQQGSSLGAPSGAVGVQLLARGTGAGSAGRSVNLGAVEWARIGLDGTLFHANLLRFNVALTPTWTQGRTSGSTNTATNSGNFLGLDGGIHILPQWPVSATINVSRHNGGGRESVGTGYDTRSSQVAADVWASIPELPIQLRLDRTNRQSERTSGLGTGLVEDFGNTSARLSAANSKTRVALQHLVTSDNKRDIQTTRNIGQFGHRFRWGKGSSLSTQLDYSSLQDFSSQFTWGERVHLQHTLGVWSDGEYRQTNRRSGPTRPTTRVGSWQVGYELGDGGMGTTGVRFSHSSFDPGRDRRFGITQSAGSAFWLPLQSRLLVTGSIGYEMFDIQTATRVSVLDERHVVDADGRFTLNHPLVETERITITSGDRTLNYQLGFDYATSAIGDLTEIIVLPTGRILVGDTVLVNYRYQTLVNSKGKSIQGSYAVGWHLGGFSVSHSLLIRRTMDGEAAAASPSTLGSRTEATIGIGFGTKTPLGRMQLDAERRYLEYTGFRMTAYDLRANLNVRTFWQGSAGVGGAYNHRDGTGGRQASTSLSGGATWIPLPRTHLRASLTYWWWLRSDGVAPSQLGILVGADWSIGRLFVTLEYGRARWGETDVDSGVRDHLFFSVSREF